MTLPKKIYLPDQQNMLIWRSATNDVVSREYEYISVEWLTNLLTSLQYDLPATMSEDAVNEVIEEIKAQIKEE